jgi:hypothetical protein
MQRRSSSSGSGATPSQEPRPLLGQAGDGVNGRALTAADILVAEGMFSSTWIRSTTL